MEIYKYDAQPIALAKDHEDYIIRSVAAIMLPELRLNNPVEISLMTPSDKPDAMLSFERPVGGLCDPSGRHIFILRNLPPGFLARAVSHELRHAHQHQKSVVPPIALRERDACLAEFELMNKIGWPTERNLIRSLSDAVDAIRDAKQSRLAQLREKLTWQEKLLADLLGQRAPSEFQKSNLATSIRELTSEITKIAAEVAGL